MAGGSRRTSVRVAAALLAGLLVGSAVLTYLSYTAAFTSTDAVIVSSPRAGLVMEKGAKVKFRGVQVGTVEDITYSGDQARLRLAIRSGEMHFIPSNATVHIAGNTIFGAKSVEFIPPKTAPSPTSLRPNAHVEASQVQLEVNTLFQSLIDLLHKIDPVELNGTLSALSEGLRGHGDDLGALLSGLNTLTRQANPKLPTLQEDFRKAGIVTNVYADAAPDLNTVFDSLPTINKTLVDKQKDLNTTLLATIGLANNAYETLEPAEQNFIDAVNRLRAPLKVLSDYSPEFGCLFKGIGRGIKEFAPLIGVRKAGLFTSSNFVLGAPAYTYPESLPIVNASGGPNCRGLPDIPTKQNGGSFYRAPFLVTDNANIPYEPFTEVQVDAPSTLQFCSTAPSRNGTTSDGGRGHAVASLDGDQGQHLRTGDVAGGRGAGGGVRRLPVRPGSHLPRHLHQRVPVEGRPEGAHRRHTGRGGVGVALNPDNTVDVTFGVDKRYTLYSSTRAVVRYENLVGDRYLEITSGPGELRKLPPGGTINAQHTQPALDLDALLGD
ncbi:hypothetical protein NIIDMKKI_03930 [Mycobacterium kansasii]|uniref:Mce related family protein n=1 Tax=Mycobacterium kansasii TaxID=1768 RepID=A0A7G1I288_MYCKA|nr:hypothetical protein NIIDMKKI_03930 [Mycobacterium kansasii]